MTEDPADQAVALLLEVMQDPELDARYLQGGAPAGDGSQNRADMGRDPLSQGHAAGCRNAFTARSPSRGQGFKSDTSKDCNLRFRCGLGTKSRGLKVG